jgi:aminoglycoside phosphotransferase
MTTRTDRTPDHVEKWLYGCLPGSTVQFRSAENLKSHAEREVWDCSFGLEGSETRSILSIFKPGSRVDVNTSLPPEQAAAKCALAMTELPAFGIPTPSVLGRATVGDQAALLTRKIPRIPWQPDSRIEAARILARIHNLPESNLSESLRHLARISDPREYRTTGAESPAPDAKTLVHGDYFSANIVPTDGGVRIVDWETFGWGDPMWDLGFLIGADRNIPENEAAAVIAEYEQNAPVNRDHLAWHRNRWAEYNAIRRHDPSS